MSDSDLIPSDDAPAPKQRWSNPNKKVTDTQIIIALTAAGGLVKFAAQKLGISRKVLIERINRSTELQAARDQIREEMLDVAEGHLLAGVRRGDSKDVHYYLRTIGKKRGYSERYEITGKDGEAVQVEDVTAERESFERRIARAATLVGADEPSSKPH